MFRVAGIFLLVLALSPVHGAQPEKRLDIFCVPLLTETVLQKEKCSLMTNLFSGFLPGKLYDIRPLFGGGTFAPGEFAVFNPESRMCVVYGHEGITDIAEEIASRYTPATYMTINGSISIGADADGKDPSADLARWRVSGKDMEQMDCASKDDHGVRYRVQFEPVLAPNGKTIDVDYIAEITWLDHDYGTRKPQPGEEGPAPGVTVIPGRRATIKLGETPEGKGVYLHIGVQANLPPQPSHPADPATVRKGVLQAIGIAR